MNWQGQVPNLMDYQYFLRCNQMQFPNQLLPLNGFNGWSPQINQQWNYNQNNIKYGRNRYYISPQVHPSMHNPTPMINMPHQAIRPQINFNQVPQMSGHDSREERANWGGGRGNKRKFHDQGQNSWKPQNAVGVQEGNPGKRQKMDLPVKHTKFMSISEAPESLPYEEKLSMVIWNNFTENRQSDQTFQKKRRVQEMLRSMLESLGRNAVHIVGSTMNGFGSEKSDCDMCLHITSNENAVTKRVTQTLLLSIQHALQVCHCFMDVQFIPARVPILKFKDRYSGIECDLNVNNTAGLLNTRLLAMYSRFDWRVRPLAMFVKHWARLCDIHDASRGRLSSYSFNLMTIQFLQHGCSPPILPSLQKDYQHLFSMSGAVYRLDMSLNDIEPVIHHWRSNNSENFNSLGKLFTDFIAYFNFKIDFSKDALSVRLGKPIPISVAIQQMPDEEVTRIMRGNYNYKMFIEEPFTLLNASRSPYEESVFAIVQRAFRKTHRMLKLRKDIADVGPV